jgi:hypothetical protein
MILSTTNCEAQTMKNISDYMLPKEKISDYIFDDSWRASRLNLTPNEEYIVLKDLDNLKKGELVKFIGYDDVDNHFGIFVFTDSSGKILEIRGDFSGYSSLTKLENAFSKA